MFKILEKRKSEKKVIMFGEENVVLDKIAEDGMTTSDVYNFATTKDEVQKVNTDTMNINKDKQQILTRIEQTNKRRQNLQTRFSQLLELKDMKMEGNRKVMNQGEHINTFQKTVESNSRYVQIFQEKSYKLLESNDNILLLRQNSGQTGADLPPRVAELFLPMAKKEDWRSLNQVEFSIE